MGVWVFRGIFVLATAGTAYSVGLGVEHPFVALVLGIVVSFVVSTG